MPFADRDGVSIHYEVFGEGKPIVLIHGFASSLKGNWVNPGWVDALTPIRQVVALDCRGHGESGKPDGPDAYAGDAMSEDVIAVMDDLDIARADVFGYSLGGGIALRLLAAHPARFRSAIVGGVGERNDDRLQALGATRRPSRSSGGGAGLASLTVPVLIVNGGDDRAVGSPETLAAAIPGARLVKIPNRDHLTVVGDQRFRDAVVAFLQEQDT